jgi:predicted deacetylase
VTNRLRRTKSNRQNRPQSAAKNEWKFMREAPNRSRLALLFRIMEELGGQEMKEQFKRDVLPRLKLSENAFSELSEQEFEHSLLMMKKELPAYKEWLLQNPSGAFL